VSRAISVFGLGYVGSVTAACFASKGHRVIGVDINQAKVEMLEAGRSPIVEARMQELVAENHHACRLHATTDAKAAVRDTDLSFVCVGTPSLRSGKLDLSHVGHVAREIGAALVEKKSAHTVVLRSTVLPGTTEAQFVPELESASGLRAGRDFHVCYNPEFMREGSAVADFLEPPYTIMGASKPEALSELRGLYDDTPGAKYETSVAAAEMVKYVSNAFHAVKVGFANEIGTLCKSLGVDTEVVTRIFTSDTKLNISSAYLSPGFAFGGSCLPKDLRALTHRAKELDLSLPLLEAILHSNQEHVNRSVEAVLHTGKKRFALLGLSFKDGTDDLRESPQVQLVKYLLREGCQVTVWDPNVSMEKLVGSNRQSIEEVIPSISSLLSSDLRNVLKNTDVVVIGTRAVKAAELAMSLTPDQSIIDFVNLSSSERPQGAGSYDGICW